MVEGRSAQDSGVQLTSAAQEFLNNVIDDIRAEVMAAAVAESETFGLKARQIGVGELVTALERLGYTRFGRRQRRSSVQSLSLVLALSTGTIAAIAVGLVAAIQSKGISNTESLLLGFLAAFSAGLGAVGVSGFVLLERGRAKSIRRTTILASAPDSQLNMRFIQEWIDFEAKMRSVVGEEMGESAAARPMTSLVRSYAELKSLSDEETLKILTLLRMRNTLVHGQNGFSREELSLGIRDLRAL